jgi:hypothetical protein
MTTDSISRILDSYLTELEGQPGFWRGTRDEVQLFVLSDESHDRVRIMAPIGEVKDMQPELLQVLLQANYDRALDARYAMRGREVWSVSVHPLATLAPDDFADFLDQVVRLVKNTGSSYASSDLVFGGGVSENGDEDDDDEAAGGDETETNGHTAGDEENEEDEEDGDDDDESEADDETEFPKRP